MSNIDELQKEVGLLREKVELLRTLEELKAREAGKEVNMIFEKKEYTPWPWPYPVYPYGPYPSPWWGIDLTPKVTYTTGGSTKTGNIVSTQSGLDFTGGG